MPNATTQTNNQTNALSSASATASRLTAQELQALAAEQEARYVLSRVRGSIDRHAGDPLSLLGTVADVAQMLLVWHCELIEAAKTATTVAQLKTAITNSPLAAETAKLVADTKAGNTRWPYQLKGAAKVTDDVELRATVTHDAIKAGAKAAL